jgi:hypothetical protein
MRSKLLIPAIFAGLLAGSGIAAAKIVHDASGSAFPTEGIREWDGMRRAISSVSRTARAAAAAAAARAYSYIPLPNGRKAERQARRAWATTRRQLSPVAQDARTGRLEWTQCELLSSWTRCPFDVYD